MNLFRIVFLMVGAALLLSSPVLCQEYDISSFERAPGVGAGDLGQARGGGFDGALSNGYGISIPAGRGASTPSIALGYNSRAGNGWCGVGWSLGFGSIERDGKDGPPVLFSSVDGECLNQYDDTKGFVVGTGKLILVDVDTWRVEVDRAGSYLRYEKLGSGWVVTTKSGIQYHYGEDAQSRAENPDWSGGSWERTYRWYLTRVVDTNGNQAMYEYTRDEFSHGAHIGVYYYPKLVKYNGNPAAGLPFTHQVEFELEARSNPGVVEDQVLSFRSGFREEIHQRLGSVKVTVLDQLVRRYRLTYEASSSTGKSLLTSIQQYGNDDLSTLPPVTYEYSNQALEFEDPVEWGPLLHQTLPAPSGPTEDIRSYNAIRATLKDDNRPGIHPVRTLVDFRDMNRDGRPDRVLIDRDVNPDEYLVQHMKLDGGFETTLVSYPFIAPTGGVDGNSSLGWTYKDQILKGVAALTLVDINGDGFPDRVHDPRYNIGQPGFGDDEFGVEFGNGQGFDSIVPFGPIDRWDEPNYNNSYNSARFVMTSDFGLPIINPQHLVGALVVDLRDINGDGRVDRVMRAPNTTLEARDFFRVQINTGTGFSSKQLWRWENQYHGSWNDNNYYFHNISTYDGFGPCSDHSVTSVDLIDMNGDGLPDRVMRKLCEPGVPPLNGTFDMFIVQYNKGYGFAAWEEWGPLQHPDSPGSTYYGSPEDTVRQAFFPLLELNPKASMLRDVNGDGLVDRLTVRDTFPVTQDRFSVQLNHGSGFGPPMDYTEAWLDVPAPYSEQIGSAGYSTFHFPVSTRFQDENNWGRFNLVRTDLTDVNGDGLPDRIMAVFDQPFDSGLKVQLAKGLRPDLLTKVISGLGASTSFGYTEATQSDPQSSENGVGQQPYSKTVVSSITTHEPFSGFDATTSYTYEGGLHDFERREAAGFQKVSTLSPAGIETVNYFHQGGGVDTPSLGEYSDGGAFWKRGFAFRSEIYDRNGDLASVTIHRILELVDTVSSGLKRYFPYVRRTKSTVYSAPGIHQSSVDTLVSFKYDPTTYNLTRQVDSGRVVNLIPEPNLHGKTSVTIRELNYAVLSNADIIDRVEFDFLKASTVGPILSLAEYEYWGAEGSVKAERHYVSMSPLEYEEITYAYGVGGNLASSVSPSGLLVTIEYDAALELLPVLVVSDPVTTQNPSAKNHTLETLYDLQSGLATEETNPVGIKRYTVLDEFYRPIESGIIGNNGQQQWVSKTERTLGDVAQGGPAAFYTLERSNDDSGANGKPVYSYFDGFGRALQVRDKASNGLYRVTNNQYTQEGVLDYTTLPVFEAGTAWTATTPALETHFAYDRLMRPITVIPPSGELGSPTAPSYIEYEYEELPSQMWPFGKVQIDADGIVTKQYFDTSGYLLRVRQGIGAEESVLNLHYDKLGQIVSSQNDSGFVSTQTYDMLGRSLVQTNVDSGTSTVSYYMGGGVHEVETQRQTKIEFQYDVLGRVQFETQYSPSGQVTGNKVFHYDDSNMPELEVGKGQLFQVFDEEGWVAFGYDEFGRVIKKWRWVNKLSKRYDTKWTYNPDGSIDTIKYPDSILTLRYSYKPGGALDEIQAIGGIPGNPVLYRAVGYDETGSLYAAIYGNGTVLLHERYAATKLIKNIKVFKGTNVIQDLKYEYSSGGLLTSLLDTYSPESSSFTNVQYDTLRRLKTYEDDFGQLVAFQYNGTGNILRNGELGAGSFTYNSTNPHAVASAPNYSYTYDENGNTLIRTTPGGLQVFSYDSADQVTRITTQSGVVNFGYDYGGSRLWKDNGTETRVYLDGRFEERASESLVFVSAGGLRICSISRKGGTAPGGMVLTPVITYHHSNHLASNHVNTDSAGNEVQRTVEKAFGSSRYVAKPGGYLPTDRFTGQPMDSETGLYWFGSRFYDPSVGRFLQPDDMLPAPYDTQGRNPYTYVRNNPLGLVDPTGNSAEDLLNYIMSFFGLSDGSEGSFGTMPPEFGGPPPEFSRVTANAILGKILEPVIEQVATEVLEPAAVEVQEFGKGAVEGGIDGSGLPITVGLQLVGLSFAPHPMGSYGNVFDSSGGIGLTRKLGYGAGLVFGLGTWLTGGGEVAGVANVSARAVRFGPMRQGALPQGIANTFRSGSYTARVSSEATTLFRVHGGSAGELGQFWTRTRPAGPLQSKIDLALNPAWGNTATQVTTIRVPAGATMYEGFAASQGGLVGGGSQVVIPRVNSGWIVK